MMDDLNGLAQELESLGEVDEYVLVSKEGHLLLHRCADPDVLASVVALCGLAACNGAEVLGSAGFRHLACSGKDGKTLVVAQSDRHFLGAVRNSGGGAPALAARLSELLSGQAVEQS